VKVGSAAGKRCLEDRSTGGWTIVRRLILLAALAAGLADASSGATWASALPDTTAAASASVRLILLGTNGGPGPIASRSEPANLLVVNGTPYLIDAGAGVERQIVLAGFKTEDIRRIFITHHHIDHNGALVPLVSTIWFETAWHNLARPAVEIYGPPSTRYLVGEALAWLGVSERIFRAGVPDLVPAQSMFQAHDIADDGEFYHDQNLRVMAIENTHFHFKSESAAGPDKSYSYRFDTPAGSIVFTGDTGPSEAVTHLAEKANVLVSEVCLCSEPGAVTAGFNQGNQQDTRLKEEEAFHAAHEHLTPEEVGRMAAQARVHAVILTHFVPGDERDMSKFTKGVQSTYPGPVIAGQDLFEYDLR
jgi:ribonuclease BN (tRNA processing enzyme)